MQSIEAILGGRFIAAIGKAFGPEYANDAALKPGDARHGDYQCNAAMALAKQLGQPPRKVAESIIQHLAVSDMCETPQIAGPGFINLRLLPQWLERQLSSIAADPALLSRGAVDAAAEPQTVVVDYAGPNIAKEMHVGHLRSSILGDALARTLAFLGHQVIRQNHVGDFGTQFGMLIRQGRELSLDRGNVAISDLDAYYKQAAQRDKEDPQFAAEARQAVVDLQHGKPEAVSIWHWIVHESRRHCRELFDQLGITLTPADERGESFYKDRLPKVVALLQSALGSGGDGPDDQGPDGAPATAAQPGEALVSRAFATVSDGAVCVFLPGYVDKDKKPLPLIIQKSDGAFLYATTDLAALHFRIIENKLTPEDQAPLNCDWHAQRVIYTTDSRQAQHFSMVFDALHAAHWDTNPVSGRPVRLEHAAFGAILGDDGKPFKTRSGESVKLRDLLAEAVQRADEVLLQKRPDLSAADRHAVAKAVGIGAIKYADLRQDRTTDYIFNWDRMLSFEGNTGPYLQYTYARICSILRKARQEVSAAPAGAIILTEPQEIALAKKLLAFASAVDSVVRDLRPHHLCYYLYELCGAYSSFYENCPVLKAADATTRHSRLQLCVVTAGVLRVGLQELLGIAVLEEM